MRIANLFENYITEETLQLVVIYPGRFQPFHLGHRGVFQSLQQRFGRDNVFIATSNKTELPKSPFNFNDKVQFITAAGVSADRILEVSNPYKLPEQFNPEKTIFLVAVGAPDRDRLRPDTYKKDGNPSYYKTFTKIDESTTADKHGYVIIAEERHKIIKINGKDIDVSHGTESRAAWNAVRNNPKGRSEFLLQMYGRDDPELGYILDKIPQQVSEDSDPELKNLINYAVGHYPNVGSRGEAFMKFVQRSLKHGLETDIDQQKKINELSAQIDQLKKLISTKKINQDSTPTKPKFVDENHDTYTVIANGEELPCNDEIHAENKARKLLSYRKADIVYVAKNGQPIYSWKLGEKKQPVSEDAAGVGVVKNSKDPRYVSATMGDQNDVTAATLPKMMSGYHLTKKYKKLKEEVNTLKEKWSEKYKRSINCSHPKGFSQRAHCAGRKKK